MLRATREDPAAAQAVGISVHRQRLWAFTLSGALCGFAGGLLVHMLGSITTEQVYLELTFLTLAMLVVGGDHEPLGSGRRRARGERARLAARERRGRIASASRSTSGGLAADRPRRADGADAVLRPVRAHRRARAAAAAGGPAEGLRRRVAAPSGQPLRGQPRVARRRRGVGVRPRRGARRRDQRARPAADGRGRGARDRAPRDERRRRAAGLRLRDRRDEGDAHGGRDRRDRARLRGRRGRVRPERRRQRGGDRRARRARDPRHDVPCRKDPRAGRRAVGRQGRHDLRPVRAEPGGRARRSSGSPTRAPAAACRRRRSPTRAARSGGR